MFLKLWETDAEQCDHILCQKLATLGIKEVCEGTYIGQAGFLDKTITEA